jgi:hypothetical protein
LVVVALHSNYIDFGGIPYADYCGKDGAIMVGSTVDLCVKWAKVDRID